MGTILTSSTFVHTTACRVWTQTSWFRKTLRRWTEWSKSIRVCHDFCMRTSSSTSSISYRWVRPFCRGISPKAKAAVLSASLELIKMVLACWCHIWSKELCILARQRISRDSLWGNIMILDMTLSARSSLTVWIKCRLAALLLSMRTLRQALANQSWCTDSSRVSRVWLRKKICSVFTFGTWLRLRDLNALRSQTSKAVSKSPSPRNEQRIHEIKPSHRSKESEFNSN